MKTYSTLLFLYILLRAHAITLYGNNSIQNEAFVVEAEEAAYNENQVFFKENVHLTYALGKISANYMEIIPHPEKKKFEKGILNLVGNVQMDLKDGGSLNCAKASINFSSNSGIFEGDKLQPDVIYRESCKDKSKSSLAPLRIKSKKMSVEISPEDIKTKTSSNRYLSKIVAQNEVVIDYNQVFIAESDFASFDKQKQNGSNSSAPLAGLITLKAENDRKLCKITHDNGDLIEAKHICIDTSTKQIGFSYPKGFIITKRSDDKSKEERVDFRADTLIWNDQNQQLVLKDHVLIKQEGFLSIANQNQIKITQAILNNKKQIETIESEGKTVLTGFEPLKNKEHYLTGYGKTLIDHARLLILMESPIDAEGKVQKDQQLYFEDDLGKIYADKLSFQYKMENKSIVPQILILEGNVKMLNSYAAGSDPTSPLIRYALADKVEYNPKTKEAIFSSNQKRKRVLFYDKANDMEVSANTLKIKRDEVTKKEMIKGVGDVRFSFIENEFEQLINHFLLEKDKK